MSNYQEEHGTYILPTAEVSRLKKILINYTNDLHEQVKTEVHRLHGVGSGDGKTGTRSVKKYAHNLIDARVFNPMWAKGVMSWDSDMPEYKKLAMFIMDNMVRAAEKGVKGIHKPTVAEISKFAPRATSKTTEFTVDEDAYIILNGRNLTWGVRDNNRSVDNARNSVLGRKFWAFMDSVSWTRNTGGYTLYTDEYRRELGGGGEVKTSSYGPLG